MTRIPIFAALAAGIALSSPTTHAAPSITEIGLFPGGTFSNVFGISADGSIVAGFADTDSGWRAFRWTGTEGIQSIGTLGGTNSVAYAISADGNVFGGFSNSPDGLQAYRWTAGDGMQGLGFLPGDTVSQSRAINADGSVIVGDSRVDAGSTGRGFIWTATDGMQEFEQFPGGTTIALNAITPDAAVVVGAGLNSGGDVRAFRWTSESGIVETGVLPGSTFSSAMAVSADGSVLTGWSGTNLNSAAAFRWTPDDGMQSLGILPGDTASLGSAINADGSVIVGSGTSASGSRAIMWTESLGLIDLNAYLPTLGVDLTGWNLTAARAISHDGTTITGIGSFNGTAQMGWIVTGIPTPSTAALLALGALATSHRRR